MSNIIDNRIVEMMFDNSDFEKNVKVSMNTLNDLNKTINTTGSAKGLTGLADSVKGFSLEGVTQAIENVSGKFTSLGIIGVTALQNITNQAIDAGKRMIESLTIAPISEGFNEYELKMGSIQTIMAGTGEPLEVVNERLEELNHYADKTIYSFKDMTSNIGKFTNQGVKLDDAVKAIQGIANEAALSGANAEQASHAMYNFAQALSAGYVKLIDWKSIENAMMATKEFKEELIKTALEIGTVVKEGDEYRTTTTNMKGETSEAFTALHAFNDSLSYQWLTTDVLTQTLAKYTDETTELGKKAFAAAQDIKTFSQMMDTLKEAVGSGWAQSFEIIFGDFNEAKGLWTTVGNAVSEIIEKTTEARNSLLKGWDEGGGRTAFMDAIAKGWENLKKIIDPIKKAFNDIFPPLTAQRLIDFSNGLKDLISKFKISDDASSKLYRTFKGLFSIFDIGKQAFSALINAVKSLYGYIKSLNLDILGFTANIGDFFTELSQKSKSMDFFNKIFTDTGSVIKTVIDWITEFISVIRNNLGNGMGIIESIIRAIAKDFNALGESVDNTKGKITGWFTGIVDGIKSSGIFSIFKNLFDLIKGLVEVASGLIGNVFGVIGDSLSGIFESIKSGNSDLLFSFVNEGLLVTLAVKLTTLMDSFSGVGKSVTGVVDSFANFGKVFNSISDFFSNMSNYLTALTKNVQANTVLKIAEAVGVLALSCLVLASIDSSSLGATLGAVTSMMVELMMVMSYFNKTKPTGLKNAISSWIDAQTASSASTQLIKLAAAVLVMSFAMKSLSGLNWEQVGVGLASIAGLFIELIASMRLMPKDTQIKKLAGVFITMGIAINIMALALKQLSGLNLEQIGIGLIGIGGALAAIMLTLAGLSFVDKETTNFNKISGAILVMSIALNAMASALKIFGSMNLKELGIAIGGLVASLGSLVGAFYGISKIEGDISKAAGQILIMGIALNVIAASLKIFGSMNLEEFIIGIGGMAASLTILVGAFLGMSMIEGEIKKVAGSMLVMGIALNVIAASLKIFGSMNLEEFIIGIGGMAASLTILVGAFLGMSMIEGSILKSASAMLVMGIALNVVASAVKIFGSLGLGEMIVGLVGMGGALLIMVGALSALGEISGKAILAASALLILGTAVGVFALSIKLLSTIPLKAMAIALGGLIVGLTGVSVLAAVLSSIAGPMLVFAGALIAISAAVALFGAGIFAIGAGIGMLANGLLKLSQLGTESIKNVKAVFEMILEAVAQAIPRLIEAIVQGYIELLKVIGENAPVLIKTIGTLITSVLAALNEKLPEIIDSLVQFIVMVITKIAENIPAIYNAAVELIIAFINGITDCYTMIIEAAFQAIIKFINALSDTIEKHIPELADAIKRLFETIIKAAVTIIVGSIPFLKTSGKELMDGGFLKGLKEKINDVIQIGKDFVMGFVNGIKNTVNEAVSTAKQFGKDVLSTIKGVFDEHSPSKETEKIGKYAVDGLVIGIKKLASKAVTAAKDMSEKTLNAFDLSSISSVIDMDGFSPVITPVLDLTNLQNGTSQIDSMFAGRTISATVDAINQNGSASNAVIGELKDEIIKLNERMSNIKVMLDSGTMVGAMIDDIDTQLGVRAVYAGRGI